MTSFLNSLKIARIVLAAPFVLIGAILYWVAEVISGEKYVRHEELVERNTIYKHNYHQVNLANKRAQKKGSNFTKPKKRRK